MTAEEAYKKMIEYSSSRDNCCWYVGECVNGEGECDYEDEKENCKYYQAFSKVKKALKILEMLEEEQIKQIDRKKFEKALKLTRKYNKTGDTDFSDEAFDYFYYLSKKSSTDYFVFTYLAYCFEKLGTSDEKIEQVMNLLGFELVEEE